MSREVFVKSLGVDAFLSDGEVSDTAARGTFGEEPWSQVGEHLGGRGPRYDATRGGPFSEPPRFRVVTPFPSSFT